MPKIVFHRGLLKPCLPGKPKDSLDGTAEWTSSHSAIYRVASFIGIPTLRGRSSPSGDTSGISEPQRRAALPLQVAEAEDSTIGRPMSPNQSMARTTSGPIGAGRTHLLFRIPEIETGPVATYDAKPPDVKGDMSFFRCTEDLGSLPDGHDTTGMETLRLSGSERIRSVEQVQRIKDKAGTGPLVVLDLRQESHATAGDHTITWRGPMDWANIGLSLDEVVAKEAEMIEQARQQGSVTMPQADYIKGKVPDPEHVTIETADIQTEQQIVEAAGATYGRLAVIDHARPDRETVDRFIDIVRSLPEGAALHVHCNGGRGRTTTFMVMYDMLRNAKVVNSHSIIERQSVFGFNYNMTNVAIVAPMKRPFIEDRLGFLHEFHRYARENPDGRPLKWSEWRTANAQP